MPQNPMTDGELLLQKLDAVARASIEKRDALIERQNKPVVDVHYNTPGDTLQDIGIKAAQGVVDVGQFIVGLGSLATGGLVGQGARAIGFNPEATNQFLGQYLSPEQQAADLKVQQSKGFMDTMRASLENPRAIFGSVVESLPGMVAGMGVTGLAAKGIALKAAMATAEGEAAASAVLRAGGEASKAAEAALATRTGAAAAQEAINAAETRLLVTGATTEGAQSAGQIADQAQGEGRAYSDYALPAIAAGVGTAGLNLLAGKLMGSAETDMAAGTHTLKGGFLGKIAKEGFSEGVLEEMPQSAQEQIFTNIATGKAWDEGVGNAAASGLLAGAAMGAGMGGLHGGSDAPKEQKAAPSPEQVAAKATAMVEALQSGDTSALVDRASKTYDPVAAVSVLAQMNQKDDTTQEDRTKNVEDAYNIVAKLTEQRKSLVEQAKRASKSDAKRLMSEAAQVYEKEQAANGVWDTMMTQLSANPAPVQVKALVQTANTPTATKKDIDSVVKLATSSSEHLSATDAINLANNKANNMDDSQRELLRAFGEARLASNLLKSGSTVQQEIYFGSPNKDMIGLSQYRERIGKAIDQGAQKAASYQMGMLSRFADDHAAKAQVAREALTKYGLGSQIHKTEDGHWIVPAPADYLKEGALRKNGGWEVRSEKGVKEFETEADALAKTRTELQLAMGLRFGKESVQSITPTPAPTATQLATPGSPSVTQKNTAPLGNISIKENVEDKARLEREALQSVANPPHSTKVDQNTFTAMSLLAEHKTPQAAEAAVLGLVEKAKQEGNIVVLHNQGKSRTLTTQKGVLYDNNGNRVEWRSIRQGDKLEIQSPSSSTRSASPTTASSVAGAPSSQSGSPALENPKPTTPEQAAAAGPAVVSAANPAPAREAAPAVGKGLKPKQNTGGSVDGRLLASHAEALALQNYAHDTEQFGTEYQDASYRALTVPELTGLKEALKIVATQFAKELGEIRFVAMEHPKIKGTMFSEHHLLALRADTFTTNQAQLVHIIAHELAHQRDYNNGYASTQLEQLQPGGTVYQIALASIDHSAQLKKAFGYFMGPTNKGVYQNEQVPMELYAQLLALNLTNPELFNEGQPLAHTLEAIHGNPAEGRQDQGRVDEGVPHDVAGTGPETGGQSTEGATSGEGAQQPPVKYSGLRIFSQKMKDLPAKIHDMFKVPGFNPLVQFLSQREHTERYETARPLVQIGDFLSAWAKDGNLPYQFIDKSLHFKADDERADFQKAALDSVYSFLHKWAPQFSENLALRNEKQKNDPRYNEYRYVDQMQFLLEQTEHGLDLEENVKTAMAAAMYQWILAQSNDVTTKTREAINAMNGRDSEGYVSPEGIDALETMAGHEAHIIDQLGGLASDALGFQADQNAPQDLLPRLRTALGTHVLLMLEKGGYLERIGIPAATVESFFTNPFGSEEQDKGNDTNRSDGFVAEDIRKYVRLARDGDRKLTGEVQAIRDANVKTGGVIERLFGSEKAAMMAGTKPVKFTQKYAKGTRQEIGDLQRQAVEETMTTPHSPIPAMLQLFAGLGRDMVLKVAGWTEADPERLHVVNQKAAEAQNQNLERQFDRAFDMIGTHGEDAEFYVEQHVGKNFRAYFSNQSLNQQTSKIHRVLFARPEWNVTIDLNNQEMVNEYLVSVAMSFGRKTDATKNVVTLPKFDTWLKDNPQVMEAVNIIREGTLGTNPNPDVWTDANREKVMSVARDMEGMMSLQALMSFAQYIDAKESGAKSFDTTLLVGVDGKTNGPMLSHLALGAADSVEDFYALLNRGGFYSTDEGQAEHYSDWYGQGGNQDLYEHLGAQIITAVREKIVEPGTLENLLATAKALPKGSKEAGRAWAEFFNHFTDNHLKAVEITTKELLDRASNEATKAMRGLTKTPLTSFAFGSALKKSVANMRAAFIDSYYTTLQDLASGARKDVSSREYIQSINTLLSLSWKDKYHINESLPIHELLKRKLTTEQVQGLNEAFDRVIGKSVEEVMNSYFATFIDRRRQLNTTVQASYEIYEAAYKSAMVKEMQRLMDNGEIAYAETKQGKRPLHAMSAKQEAKVRESLKQIQPVMHSAYSAQQNDIGHGLYLSQGDTHTATSTLYKSDVTVNYVPARMGLDGKPIGKVAKNVPSFARTWVEQAPGVIGGSYPIHSGDSFVMHSTMVKVPQTLNVHDEGSNSVLKTRLVAQALNEYTAKLFLNYSPVREALHMMERMLTHMVQAIKAGTVDASAASTLFEQWANIYNRNRHPDFHITAEQARTLYPQMAAENAFRADYMLNSGLAKLKSVDQYVWEGGQFYVTDAMRAQAQARIEALSSELQVGTQQALDYLYEVADSNPSTVLDPHGWLNVKDDPQDRNNDAQPKVASPFTPAVTAAVQEQLPATHTEAETAQQLARAADNLKEVVSPWGELGAPVNASNPRLVAAFEAKPVMNTREVLALLRKELGREPLQGLYGNLIGLMSQYLPDMEVRYVTRDTPVGSVLEGADKSRGWYVSKDGKQGVYLLSPEHKHSQLTVETVLHELLHAGLARTIESEKAKARISTAYNSEKLQLVQELESLLEKAKAYVSKNSITGFEEALKDVHEFTSWGLTNQAFQDQVVKQISTQSTTGKTSLVQNMKDFISKVVKLVFFGAEKSRQAQAVNGLSLLVTNVAGLYSQVAKADSRIKIVNRMASGQNLRNYTTHDIFNALPSNRVVSSQFEDRLRSVLDSIVGKLFGPMGSFREAIMQNSPQLPEDLLQHAMLNDAAPFAQKIMAAGFLMSDKEAFVAEQVEASVRAALDSNTGQTAAPYKELSRLYEEAVKTVKVQDLHPGNWALATQAEKDHAKQLHDFIFAVEQGANKRSDYLSRFAALGIANEQFAQALGFRTEIRSTSLAGKSLSERLYAIFETILTWINGKLTHTYDGQVADEKLTSLVEQLVTIEAKKRNKIHARQTKLVGVADDLLRGAAENTRKAVEKMASSKFFRESKNVFVQAGGAMVATVAGDRVGEMMRNINHMRNTMVEKKRGIIMGLMDEVRGANSSNMAFHIMLRATKVIEGDRKKLITAVGNATRQSFDDKGSYLTDAHDAAITAAALRTDMAALLAEDRYDIAGLTELVKDRSKLAAAIKGLEEQLQQFGNFQHYYQKQAKGLAWHKVVGGAKVVEQMFNAGNIARAYGTPYSGRVSDSQAHAAEGIIDALTSLYAMQYTSREKMNLLGEIMDREAARTDGGNGVLMVLLTHKQLQKDSQERLFSGTEALRMKGYIPEIYNPHIEVVAASGDEAEMLRKIGYSEQEKDLPRDPADQSEAKRLFVYRDGGLQSYQSGIVSTTDTNKRGTPVFGADVASVQQAKQQAVRDLFRADPNFDPSKVTTEFMAPVLNPQGEPVEYRYMMTEVNKDTLLERHNGFDKILGMMAGNVFDKEESREQNQRAVQALKDQFDQEYATNPKGYVVVGPNSNDKELREIWRLFPEAMKQDIRDIWGNNNMRVRADLLDINFGYRKLSLANVFEKDNVEKNLAGKLLQDLMVHILKEDDTEAGREVGRRKAQLKVRIAENIWQELVKMAKENMVLKSVSTLMGNFRSNVILLLWSGVNPLDLAKHHQVAMKGALAYRRDNNELIQLKLSRDSGYLMGQDKAVVDKRITRLEDAIARNPVKPLIDAGMMPTIVEDVSADDDLYSYRSRYTRGLEQKIENVAGSINPHVRNVFDTVMLAKDTPLYKAMSYGTQLSDFVARYTLYQHLTTRKTNPLSKDVALNRISEAFVNYDVPSHRKVQYANDMGLVYFTKYYLRIQKVLVQLYRENPGRAMMMLTAGHYFDTASELTNSSFMHHIGNNPFSTGALKAVTTLDETAVIKGALSVFK